MNWKRLISPLSLVAMLTLLSVTIGLPWWAWAIWAALFVIAIAQAVRS